MHIPDGFISPLTYIPATVAAIPLLVVAFKKTKEAINDESFALLSSLTAFSFVVMMFNIPIPGGTSGHAIGAAILAILFGPWVAAFCLSLTLFIQALIFGDGGLSVFAINSLAMGFVASFSAFYVHKLLKNRMNNTIALFLTGWSSIVFASVVVAVALGIQPLLGVDSAGHPIYFPFGLEVTIPAVVGSHLLFFGVVEGFATMLVMRFLEKMTHQISHKEVLG
ncbi:cobalamin (vitamin B12) biosynthesis CbiM protein [Sulfuricurvum kujiense DSM 16994]|uniref:Cobalamin (Vitamin B12) biosynthesis CbiM protein n=1 Tax=Sulfuricurvum kujiense (strain ATCC BAA-921 / DSM 16994 / JCM 11577 / YK-1) TaxID=709032 RepID=E4U2L3_SULKY|nr:cobalt transporter CbiM [Sulfuricurvum kujiense]ADR34700.1 cobalamin (vitamin B12) biosynthesis CbiM protein [Sulfuricurvum kujiense DSM 16994]